MMNVLNDKLFQIGVRAGIDVTWFFDAIQPKEKK
jgi:hypothetical protein